MSGVTLGCLWLFPRYSSSYPRIAVALLVLCIFDLLRLCSISPLSLAPVCLTAATVALQLSLAALFHYKLSKGLSAYLCR